MDAFTEERPWGSFRQFTKGELTTVKILNIKAGEAFSKQYHHKRKEFWYVISGEGSITVGEETKEAKAGDEFSIDIETVHRIQGAKQGISVLEISYGEFDEEDIVRLEDKYGRP